MTEEQAKEIVVDCVSNALYGQDWMKNKPTPSLAKYSLSELVEANHIVRDIQDDSRLWVHCDDRIIAALYTIYHHDAGNVVTVDDKAILIVNVEDSQND